MNPQNQAWNLSGTWNIIQMSFILGRKVNSWMMSVAGSLKVETCRTNRSKQWILRKEKEPGIKEALDNLATSKVSLSL